MRSLPCRVRFAPSPTGNLHLGSLRTALFNFLVARKNGGKLVLRIEDTDRQRLVPGCSEKFESTLNYYGIKFDESPRLGGLSWPYRQSERLHLYNLYSEVLLQSGHAYRCFCTPQRLEILRRNATARRSNSRYDGRCRTMERSEINSRLANAEPSVIRFVFGSGQVHFKDDVFGESVHDVDEGDFVIIKSDGFPTYHFANVVDDHTMQISHVVRGAEWLSSTPKHVQLYKAFNWSEPRWLHLPLITRDGCKKLSKRNADAFVQFYDEQEGYLPLAVLNFLLRNGSGIRNFNSNHLYTLDEMVEHFDETLITRNPFMMDNVKLQFYGQLSVRHAHFEDELFPAITKRLRSQFPGEIDEELLNEAYVHRVVNFLRKGEESFSKLSELTHGDFRFFFCWPKERIKSMILEKLASETALEWLDHMLNVKYPDGWRAENLKVISKCLSNADDDSGNASFKQLTRLLRISLVGNTSGPPISELVEFFSANECHNRLRSTMELLLSDSCRPFQI